MLRPATAITLIVLLCGPPRAASLLSGAVHKDQDEAAANQFGPNLFLGLGETTANPSDATTAAKGGERLEHRGSFSSMSSESSSSSSSSFKLSKSSKKKSGNGPEPLSLPSAHPDTYTMPANAVAPKRAAERRLRARRRAPAAGRDRAHGTVRGQCRTTAHGRNPLPPGRNMRCRPWQQAAHHDVQSPAGLCRDKLLHLHL